MRIAALYDIHGNLPALEAVLVEVKQLDVDQVVLGGDVVLGPMSRECLDLLLGLEIPVQFILGNCEVSILASMQAKPLPPLPTAVVEDIEWTAAQLLQEHQAIMQAWPKTINIQIDGLGQVLFCHATPRDENENFTRLTAKDKLIPIFENIDANVIVCGHTHMQFDRKIGDKRIVNAGSVGMPFGKPGAYWLLLGPTLELRFTAYELEAAAKRIQKTTYPHAKDFSEKNVLEPPSEETMLEIFRQAELS